MKKRFSKIIGVAVTLAMLGSLIIAPAASALTAATVTLTHATVLLADDISQAGVTYTVTLTLGTNLPEGTGTITILAPTGTLFTATDAAPGNVTMSATSGLGSGAFSAIAAKALDGTTTAGTLVITIGDVNTDADELDFIGAGALLQLVITLVQNGPTPSEINVLSIKTSVETTAVASQVFTLAIPYIPPVAGIVRGLNVSGVKLYEATGNNAISGAFASAGVVRIEVGPGTYDEGATLVIPVGRTVVSTDGPATTLITDANSDTNGGDVTITGATVSSVLDGFTITGGVAVLAVGATTGVTVQNCVLSNAGGPALDIQNGTTTGIVLSSGNTITAGTATVGQTGINVLTAVLAASSTGDIITLAGALSTGITVNGAGVLTVTGATITGASGTGINSNGTLTLTGSTLSGLETAIIISAGTATVTANTITACGDATVALLNPTIDITALPTSVRISGNTIADSPEAILEINGAGSALVTFFNFNTITNAAVGVDNLDAGNAVDCTNNYWGAATGPAVVSTAVIVKTAPFLRGPIAAGAAIYPAVATLTNTTVGVIVTDSLAGAWVNAGVALYDDNPGTSVPLGIVTKYFDVYVNTAANNIVITALGIQSTGALLYAWSSAQTQWVLVAPQVIDQFQGAVIATISAGSIPTLANLAAMEFALVEPTPVVAVVPVVPVIGTPVFGDMAAAIQPTFTWTAPATAVSYEFVLAEDPADTSLDKFAIIDYSATTEINGHVAREQLKYDTVYNWRVRAVNAVGPGPWATGFFTTITEPVPVPEPIPPVIIKETPPTPAPEIILNVPPATKQEVQVIPEYMIWVVVAVAAVLIIAVIVLIVRTRRVA